MAYIHEAWYLIGVPSVLSAVLLGILGYSVKRFKQERENTEALKKGVQALLRDRLIEQYNKWDEKGFAPIYARQNFENCWEQYHTLGDNGVMDDLHDKFLRLPTE